MGGARTQIPGSMIRVLSERIIRPAQYAKVGQIMSGIETSVQRVPGLAELETLQCQKNPNKYIILTKWRSQDEYESWLKEPSYRETQKRLDTLLEGPAKYTVLNIPREDMFLL